MRFIGPEEDGIVAVSRTPGSSLAGIFAAGTSLSDAASPSEGGGKRAEGSGYSATWGKVSLGSLANMGFSAFYIFPCTWECCHHGYHDSTCFF
jgi:hypothetical protein